LGVGADAPSALTVSSIECVSNAALFQSAAKASPGRSQPAAANSESSVTPLPAFKTFLRLSFMHRSPIPELVIVVRAGRPRPAARRIALYLAPPRIQRITRRPSLSDTWVCGGIGTAPQVPAPPARTLTRSRDSLSSDGVAPLEP